MRSILRNETYQLPLALHLVGIVTHYEDLTHMNTYETLTIDSVAIHI